MNSEHEESTETVMPPDSNIDLAKRPSPNTSDSESDGDDDEEEEDDFRKDIIPILNLGKTLTALWPISLIEQVEDAVAHEYLDTDQDSVVPATHQHYWRRDDSVRKKVTCRSLSLTRHRRTPSLPLSLRSQLDDIQLNSDYEYGFNPQRFQLPSPRTPTRTRSWGMGNRKVGNRDYVYGRPSSLHSDQSTIGLGSCEILSKTFLSEVSITLPPYASHHRRQSHAQNETEAKLEEKILHLRAQPSNVQSCRKYSFQSEHIVDSQKPKKHKKNLKRSLKRRLSFDSHPRRKAFVDDRSLIKLKKNGNHKQINRQCSHESSNGCVESDSDLSSIPTVHNLLSDDVDPEKINKSDTEQQHLIKLSPPPVFNEKIETDSHVSAGRDGKEKRKRHSIPQFLTAFKFPNKKAIKKLMKRKNDNEQAQIVSPVTVSPVPVVSTEGLNAECASISEIVKNASIQSVNTFERSIVKDSSPCSVVSKASNDPERVLVSYDPLSRKSCSTYSLPRVDEGKECLEFEGTLPRKACSSCINIFAVKFFRGGFSKADRLTLKRRMSDPVLTWDNQTPGCSPARPFLRKFLTPILCGFSSDKYINLQSDSYLSLNSDNASIASAETEFTSQQLFEFAPSDVAKELSLVDKELLIRITWVELSNCGWMSKNKYESSPNVMNMVEFFNSVAMLVASSILAEENINLRAKAISSAIKLASKCREIQNFNSLKAILAGLQCTPIYRLMATWKQVPSRRKRAFKELSKLMSESDNFGIYRDELETAIDKAPALPFLGDFLTQIAQTQAYLAVKRKLKASVKREKKGETHTSVVDSLRETNTISTFHQEDDLKGSSHENQQIECAQINNKANKEGSTSTTTNEAHQVSEVSRHNKDIDREVVDSCPFSDDCDKCLGVSDKSENFESKYSNNNDCALCMDETDHVDICAKLLNTQLNESGIEDESTIFTPENQCDGTDDLFNNTSCNCLTTTMGITAGFAEDVNNEIQLIYEEKRTHARCDSDDSGVVLRNNRFSRTSEDFDGSRENLDIPSSPKAESDNDCITQDFKGRYSNQSPLGSPINEVGIEQIEINIEDIDDCNNDSKETESKSNNCTPRLEGEEHMRETRELEKQIRNRIRPSDEQTKFQKEYQFWKYQIAAIQYDYVSKGYIRKFLLNAAYNSEDENYHLSLTREPPSR